LINNRHKINVKFIIGFIADGDKLSNHFLVLSASNEGQKLFTLAAAGVDFPSNNKLIYPTLSQYDVTFPYKLGPGESCKILIQAQKLAIELKSEGTSGKVKVVGFYQDQINNIYRSKPFDFGIDYWENHT